MRGFVAMGLAEKQSWTILCLARGDSQNARILGRGTMQADVVKIIRARDAKLDPERLALKYAAMRKNPFAFFRATCALFHLRLPKLGRLMQAPPAWCCGDLHLENFGTFRAANKLVYFDLNDFDEALLAPCSFDLLRATASIAVARKSLGLSRTRETALMQLYVSSYAATLRAGRIGWIERDSATGPIGELMAQLKGMSRKDLLDRRTIVSGRSRRILIDGSHALEAPASEKIRIARLVDQYGRKHADAMGLPADYYEVVDIALRISGLGSLGVERYAVLVKGKGGADEMRLLDLKRSRSSASVGASPCKQPHWHSEAERVFAIQQRMQARSPAHLGFIVDRNRSYILRELQPREDRLDLSQVSSQPDGLETAIKSFGELTGFAQLRASGRQGAANADALIDYGHKDKWQMRLLGLAAQCATRAEEDWENYTKAYDKGLFIRGSSSAA